MSYFPRADAGYIPLYEPSSDNFVFSSPSPELSYSSSDTLPDNIISSDASHIAQDTPISVSHTKL
ncbi:7191_t:CDS:1, partial [Rhizophagus irregularis]